MEWFSGAKPLNTNNVVYDIFTVGKPRIEKKKSKSRPKSVERQQSIHDLHIAYDRSAKRVLRPVTEMEGVHRNLQFIDDEALDKSQHVIEEYEQLIRLEAIERLALKIEVANAKDSEICEKEPAIEWFNVLDIVVYHRPEQISLWDEMYEELPKEGIFEYSDDEIVHYTGRFETEAYIRTLPNDTVSELMSESSFVEMQPVSVFNNKATPPRESRPFRRFVYKPVDSSEIVAEKQLTLTLNANSNVHHTFKQAVSQFNAKEPDMHILIDFSSKVSRNTDLYWQEETAVAEKVFTEAHDGLLLNHFPCVYEIVEKDMFFKKMRALAFAQPRFARLLVPTYIVPHQLHNLLRDNYGKSETYIIKPVNLSRGRGIFVSRDPMSFSDCRSIVEVYIERPLLYNGRKIDFRVYLLVMAQSTYLYRDAIVRSAGKPFSMKILDTAVHLTNTSLNGAACKIRLSSYFKEYPEGTERIIAGMKLVGLAVERISAKIVRARCFELLGCDILFDDQYNPYLIELNSSPNLVYSCAADEVKVDLLSDLFGLLFAGESGKWDIL